MTAHDHDDPDRLTTGCAGCIARAEQARIDNAPLRLCVWHYRFEFEDGTRAANGWPVKVERTLTVPVKVKVPEGWTGDQVDDHYGSPAGYMFVERLPDAVPIEQTDIAVMTMAVTKVVIGDLIVDQATVPEVEQGSLL